MRPSTHRLLFPGPAETPQRDSFSRGGHLPGGSYTEPGWKRPRPGEIPRLAIGILCRAVPSPWGVLACEYL